VLEAGAAPGLGTGRESPESPESPELTWICGVAEELGAHVTDKVRASIVVDWDDRQPKRGLSLQGRRTISVRITSYTDHLGDAVREQ
jgi:hypothetical protein